MIAYWSPESPLRSAKRKPPTAKRDAVSAGAGGVAERNGAEAPGRNAYVHPVTLERWVAVASSLEAGRDCDWVFCYCASLLLAFWDHDHVPHMCSCRLSRTHTCAVQLTT